MKEERSYQNNEFKKKKANVTELIKRIQVMWLELEHDQWDWHCQTWQTCERTDTVEHVEWYTEHVSLKYIKTLVIQSESKLF